MVILKDLGLAATIRVGGKDCEEHVDPYPVHGEDPVKSNICERYIESTAGLEFEVSAETLKGGPALEWLKKDSRNTFLVKYSVDGVVDSWHLDNEFSSYVLRGVHDLATSLRKFRFADVSLHDNGINARDFAHDKEVANVIGQIRVSFQRAVFTGKPYAASARKFNPGLTKDEPSLHRKALKGLAIHHTTTLSPAVEDTGSFSFCDSRDIDSEHRPFAVFVFHYRSKKGLQEELIIPAPQSDPINTADVPLDVASLSLDKLKNFARQQVRSRMDVDEKPVDVDKLSLETLIRLAREALGDANMIRRARAEMADQNQSMPMDHKEFAERYRVVEVDGNEIVDLTEDEEMGSEDSGIVDLTDEPEMKAEQSGEDICFGDEDEVSQTLSDFSGPSE